jgi:cell division protein FtsL
MKRYKTVERSKHKTKEEAADLPPRRMLHRTEKNKLTRFFYTMLTIVFIVLTISLLLWGFLFPDELSGDLRNYSLLQ